MSVERERKIERKKREKEEREIVKVSVNNGQDIRLNQHSLVAFE